jgi:hypothetical protein
MATLIEKPMCYKAVFAGADYVRTGAGLIGP